MNNQFDWRRFMTDEEAMWQRRSLDHHWRKWVVKQWIAFAVCFLTWTFLMLLPYLIPDQNAHEPWFRTATSALSLIAVILGITSLQRATQRRESRMSREFDRTCDALAEPTALKVFPSGIPIRPTDIT